MLNKDASRALRNLIETNRLEEAKLFLVEYYDSQNESDYYFNNQLTVQSIDKIEEKNEYSKFNKELSIKNDIGTRTLSTLIVTFLAISLLVTLITSTAVRSQLLVVFLILIILLIYLIKGLLDRRTKLIINPDCIEIANKVTTSIASKDILSIFLKTRNKHLETELIIFKKNSEVPLTWNIQDLELTGAEIGYQINRILFGK